MEPIPVLAFAGWSGAGKTTVIEALLPRLRALGLRVAVVKHDGHEFDIDHTGKDSWRFTQAGAVQSIVTSATRTAVVECRPLSLSQVLALTRDVDLILVEGFKREPLSQIGVTRSGMPLPTAASRYCAVVSDHPVPDVEAVFAFTALDALARFVADCRGRFTRFDPTRGALLPPPGQNPHP